MKAKPGEQVPRLSVHALCQKIIESIRVERAIRRAGRAAERCTEACQGDEETPDTCRCRDDELSDAATWCEPCQADEARAVEIRNARKERRRLVRLLEAWF